VKKYAADKMTI